MTIRSGTWPAVYLLLLAFARRIFALDAVPPGLTHDEISQRDVGLYHKAAGERWPILVDDQRVADRIMLDHVQVAP